MVGVIGNQNAALEVEAAQKKRDAGLEQFRSRQLGIAKHPGKRANIIAAQAHTFERRPVQAPQAIAQLGRNSASPAGAGSGDVRDAAGSVPPSTGHVLAGKGQGVGKHGRTLRNNTFMLAAGRQIAKT